MNEVKSMADKNGKEKKKGRILGDPVVEIR